MSQCTNKNIGQLIHLYELNLLSEEDRDRFEIHLYECEYCLNSVQEFEKVSELINTDSDIRDTIDSAVKDHAVKPSQTDRRSRHIMPAILFAAVVLVLFIFKPWQIEFHPSREAIARQNRLAILYFEDELSVADKTRLCEIATSLLTTDLSESDYLQVVSSQRIFDILQQLGNENACSVSKEIAFEVARIAGARWMITGKIARDTAQITISTQLVNVQTGEVKAKQSISGAAADDIFPLIDSMSLAIKSGLSLPDKAIRENDRPVADVTTYSQEAYQYYLTGLEFYARYEADRAIEAFNSAIELDSTFAMAYYYLARLGNREMIGRALDHSSHATKKEQLYIQTLSATRDNNRDMYIQTLEEIIQKYPDEKEANYLLGSYYYRAENYDSALTYLDKAVEIDPLYKRAINLLAYVHNAAGNYEEAILAINRYIEVAPNEANPYDTRGDIYASAGELDKALESFRQALNIQPDFHASRNGLGLYSIYVQNYEAADNHFRILLETAGQNYQIVALMGRSYMPMHSGHFEEALSRLDEAVAYDIEHFDGSPQTGSIASYHVIRSLIYLELNRYEDALDAIRTGIDVYNERFPQFQGNFGELEVHILAVSGKIPEAERIADKIDRLITSASQRYRYWYALGSIEYAKGNYDSAVILLEKADSLGYSFYQDFLLAKAYIYAGRPAKAVERLEECLNDYNESRLYCGLMNVKLHYYLGLAYENSNWPEKAIKQYQIFLDIWKEADMPVPELEDARIRLARLLNKS
jgi:tetratricopeptide (TPR) repeat protein